MKLGDRVTCVDASLPSDMFTCVGLSSVTAIANGSIHRITGLVEVDDGFAVLIDGEAPHTCACCYGANGWNPARFRKIDPASDEFTARIRRCRPLVDA